MDRSADQNNVGELATRFSRWLDDPDSSRTVVRELGGLGGESLGAFVRGSDDETIRRAVKVLGERSYTMISTAPREAVMLSRLSTRLAATFHRDDPQHDITLEGDAWKQYSSALLGAGDYGEADDACARARELYVSGDPSSRLYELTHLMLVQAQVAFFKRELSRALELADKAAKALMIGFPTKTRDYVTARTTFATALVLQQRYEEGLKALEECADVARREGHTEVLAHLVNNIGRVHVDLGNLKAAKECYATALQGFISLGLNTDIPRVHAGLARVLMQEGRYNEAISEYYKARAAFLDLKMPVVAAEASLRIIESLFAGGRLNDIAPLCDEAISTFTKANLPRAAQEALAYVNRCAQMRTLSYADVQDVREFMQRLQADPDEQFEVAAIQGGL